MLYLLIHNYSPWLQAHHMKFLRILTPDQDPFRQTAAILLSFLVSIILGPAVIGFLRRQSIGDAPKFDQAEMDALMSKKTGTPTMGGILILSSILIVTLLLVDLHNFQVRMALLCMLFLGGLGLADDCLKLVAARRGGSRQGLKSWEKLLFQFGLGVLLCAFMYHHTRAIPEAHTLYFPFFKKLQISLGPTAFIIIGTLVLTWSSNCVNLTDGLDGLATGCMAIVSFAICILALISSQAEWATRLFLPHIRYSEEMALIAAAMTGACLGFLWFNCQPARVFMGDTGSLALGGLIGYIAIVIRQEFLLFFVGGIFVIEGLSVMIQVAYFKYTRRRYGTGRRIFLMAPLHHHFQKKGWTESQVVVRFWLLSGMLAALALATVKIR